MFRPVKILPLLLILSGWAGVAKADGPPPAFSISLSAGVGSACSAPPSCGDGGLATAAQLAHPAGVAADSAGDLYIADQADHEIRKVTPAGVISTVAGTGTPCIQAPKCGDGGPATAAQLNSPAGLAIDGAGNLLVADQNDQEIRKITPAGVISTVAGTGSACAAAPNCADGGPATAAQLRFPSGVAVDGAGDLFIADRADQEIRKVTPDGTISTVAGNGTSGNPMTPGSTPCFTAAAPSCGDTGPATQAQLTLPSAVAVDPAGNIYIADTYANEIREVTTDGLISTVAGNGSACANPATCGDFGVATKAALNHPSGVSLDAGGDLLIADTNDNEVRLVANTYQPGSFVPIPMIATAAGDGNPCAAPPACGDGGSSTSAQLTFPVGLTIDASGNAEIADYSDNEVRRLVLPPPKPGPTPGTTPGGSGPTGPSGSGRVVRYELLSCRAVTTRASAGHRPTVMQRCTGKLVKAAPKPARGAQTASLSRAGSVYATGTASGRGPQLALALRRTLARGVYTLSVGHGTGRHVSVRRSRITVA